MANVLIVGPWAPSSLAFARSARRHGMGVYLMQGRGAHRVNGSSPLLGAQPLDVSLIGTDEGLDRIAAYVHEIGASAIVATVDDELLWIAEHRDRFEPACRLLTQSSASLRPLLSKIHQLDLATQAG